MPAAAAAAPGAAVEEARLPGPPLQPARLAEAHPELGRDLADGEAVPGQRGGAGGLRVLEAADRPERRPVADLERRLERLRPRARDPAPLLQVNFEPRPLARPVVLGPAEADDRVEDVLPLAGPPLRAALAGVVDQQDGLAGPAQAPLLDRRPALGLVLPAAAAQGREVVEDDQVRRRDV